MVLTSEEIEKRIKDSYELPNNVLNAVPEPIVTVRTSTYQHGPYIKDCIEGVIMQKTTFPFEFIIGEDFSTDGTRELVFEYAKKYPDIIRVITADYNVGMKANGFRCINATRGKYIALCEGDDYWTYPYKLQKQVDFLENHPEYVICFHRTVIIDEINSISWLDPDIIEKKTFSTNDLIKKNFIQTPSIMFRNNINCIDKRRTWFKNSLIGDWPLTLTLSLYGKIFYMPDVMAVYRIHKGGIHSTREKEYYAKAAVSVFKPALYYFPEEYKKNIKRKLDNCYTSLLGYSLQNFNWQQAKKYMLKKRTLYNSSLIYIISIIKDFILLFFKMVALFSKRIFR